MLRQARLRKHALLRDLRARHETQLVLLEMERRGAVDGLRASVAAERAKVAAYQQELAALDASIDSARTAMKRFRAEFEQLRVALLVDRMAKSSQVRHFGRWEGRVFSLADAFSLYLARCRSRGWPSAAVASPRRPRGSRRPWRQPAPEQLPTRPPSGTPSEEQRLGACPATMLGCDLLPLLLLLLRRLAAEREAGEARVAAERRAIDAKVAKVRATLAERYEAGFKPLLAEAEARHLAELQARQMMTRDGACVSRFHSPSFLPFSCHCSASWTCRRSWRRARLSCGRRTRRRRPSLRPSLLWQEEEAALQPRQARPRVPLLPPCPSGS